MSQDDSGRSTRRPDEAGAAEPGPAGEQDEELPSLREEFRRANEKAVVGRWASKRRAKIHAELERNRNKDYKIPTWVLAVVLVVVVVGWVLVIVFA